MKGKERLKTGFAIILPPLVSLALYANTLKNGFVYDDGLVIVNNYLIRDIANLPKLLDTAYFALSGETSYRPVVTFTYFLDHAVFGLNPWGYHFTNVALHAMNTALLYIFLTLLLKQAPRPSGSAQVLPGLPLIITLLFATHPVLTEAVNAVSFREDLLTFLFYFSTLILYLMLRSGRATHPLPSYIISCLLYLLALLSKEMALTLPFMIFFLGLMSPEGKEKRPDLFNRYNAGYAAVAVFYASLRFLYFHNPAEENIVAWPLKERLLTLPGLLLGYIKLGLLPASLSADYIITPIASFFSPSFSVPAIVICFLLAASVIFRKKFWTMTFGTCFFMTALIPVYNIAPINNPFAERYLYLPAVGLAIVTGTVIYSAYMNLKAREHVFLLIPFVLLLCIHSTSVIKRNGTWKDGYSLWSDTVRKAPGSSGAHNNLGIAYADQGRTEEAIKEYKEGLRLDPNSAGAHTNLGLAYFNQGRVDEAIEEYKTALRLNPGVPVSYNNLGVAYSRQGLEDEAIRQFGIASRLDPDNAGHHNNLGLAYFSQGRMEEAVEEYRTALRLYPDNPEAYNNIGLAYLNKNRLDDAVDAYKNAVRLRPGFAEAFHNLGLAYYKQGRMDEAVRQYNTAIELKPDYAKGHDGLGTAYFALGRMDEAIEHYLTALDLKPDYVDVYYNLGLAYAEKGATDKARETLEKALKLRPDFPAARQAIDSLR